MATANPSVNYQAYFGDIHSHCGISYGQGSIEDAYRNARLQLDFASVTGHSSWPDMPKEDLRLKSIIDYHERGFAKLRQSWKHYSAVTERMYTPNQFVTFPSYEWHSTRYGDYVFYLKNPRASMDFVQTLEQWRLLIRALREEGNECFLIPHHIGYKKGYRGIEWDSFCHDICPVVEIVSMHGCSESDDAPRAYLHTMGPRNSLNTMQMGLEKGYHFGVIGSSDHHSAYPGSYGHGKMGVWATALTRDAIWSAIEDRRTWALTGDRIELDFSLNGEPMGATLAPVESRDLNVSIKGGYALDHVEIVKNNRVLHRFDFTQRAVVEPGSSVHGKVFIEVGWGEKDLAQSWDVSVEVEGGALVSVEPRFRGADIVEPRTDRLRTFRPSEWRRVGKSGVRFKTMTYGNPTTFTNANQGMSLEIRGTVDTILTINVNGMELQMSLSELLRGSTSHYLGGFLTGAIRVHRFVLEKEYSAALNYEDHSDRERDDFYYVRVAQKNEQWAWSSPIRVGSLPRY
jgi:hypothetical protein